MWDKAQTFIESQLQALPDSLAAHRELCQNSVNRLFTEAARQTENGIFISTGDIPAMWLRDSSFQVKPLLRFCQDRYVAEFVAGVIAQQALCISIDPYANAFNIAANGNCWHKDFADQSDWVFERKWEIDSLASFMDVSLSLALDQNRLEHLTPSWWAAIESAVTVFETEVNHGPDSYVFLRKNAPKHDYLYPDGRGAEFENCGLIWSGFRPSDDACELPFNIPQNAYAGAQLERLSALISDLEHMGELLSDRQVALGNRAIKLAAGIRRAIFEKALNVDRFAYEIDGLGNQLLMDDANIPSLLSLPYLGFSSIDDSRYLLTRNFVLSEANPWFFAGSKVSHIGSPHTGHNRVWPLALAMEIITSYQTELEKLSLLRELAIEGNGFHESISVNDATDFTREWFSWAEMTYFDAVFNTAEKLTSN